MPFDENDPLGKPRLSAFTQALADLGWTDGRNMGIDLRWAGDDLNQIRALAHELVGLQPDIILTSATSTTLALQRETRTIPIVFAVVGDPVVSGIVPRLDRPSGNITGFAAYETTLGGKWLELLSEIAPGLKRAAILFNPDTPAAAWMPSFEAAARSIKLVPIIAPVHSDVEIETAIIALGREPGGGLVVSADAFVHVHRGAIISAAARNNLPTVYRQSEFAREGGLLSYGGNPVDNWRRAASYVDRILRGAKPGDLPQKVWTADSRFGSKAAHVFSIRCLLSPSADITPLRQPITLGARCDGVRRTTCDDDRYRQASHGRVMRRCRRGTVQPAGGTSVWPSRRNCERGFERETRANRASQFTVWRGSVSNVLTVQWCCPLMDQRAAFQGGAPNTPQREPRPGPLSDRSCHRSPHRCRSLTPS
jgi:putative ABC transport system substrate-binding protein